MTGTKLRIVTVSFVDDNFGDNLIRISFQALLEVALVRQGVALNDVEIRRMALKRIDDDLLAWADIIFFAGGGLFGLSYLGFYPHVDRITDIASQRGIPVVFSSMGLNNMGAEGNEIASISRILARQCVKAISVRENLELFQGAAAAPHLEVTQVADPAVWTKYVYGMTDITPDGSLGINVVRGGLFVANDRPWGLTAEMDYLSGLRERGIAAGMSPQFYTNGSLDDNNTLRYFAQDRDLSEGEVVLPQSTRDVIEAIASRSAIASIRMHSSIIAYSFGIPTVGLEWNDKLPHFYDAIGHPERLLSVEQWTPERAFAILESSGSAPEQDPTYRDYLMSTYSFIEGAVAEHALGVDGAGDVPAFDEVCDALVRGSTRIDENEFDLRVKMGKAERAYLNRFISLRTKDTQIRDLTAKNLRAEQERAEWERRAKAAQAETARLEQLLVDRVATEAEGLTDLPGEPEEPSEAVASE